MEVRVVREQEAGAPPETDYVRVRTCVAPNDDTITLATIERVVEKPTAKIIAGHRITHLVKTLIMRRPMTPDEALGLATSYAERKKIPVVYADQE